MPLAIHSPVFADGENIPQEYTCNGLELTPPLAWTGVPASAGSLALIMHDPDTEHGDFTHWVLWDIPPDTDGTAGDERNAQAVSGANSLGRVGYSGPCPPLGDAPHRYVFELYALDTRSLDLPGGSSRKELDASIANHILAKAYLVGCYQHK